MLSVGENSNGQTVDVRSGDAVRVTLSENAGTGYRWAVHRYDEEHLDMLPPEPADPAGGVGSGGEVVFVFKAKKPGDAEVELKSWRHWEGDASVTRRFKLRLRIGP